MSRAAGNPRAMAGQLAEDASEVDLTAELQVRGAVGVSDGPPLATRRGLWWLVGAASGRHRGRPGSCHWWPLRACGLGGVLVCVCCVLLHGHCGRCTDAARHVHGVVLLARAPLRVCWLT